jgi:integrase/recombinase XerD
MEPEQCSEGWLKKAGLHKRIYPHLLRHSRATELANFLTEAQMKELLGWVQGSDRASTYVHLCGRDVDGALLAANGITPDREDKKPLALSLAKCPRCGKGSGSNAQFCPVCGMVLDQITINYV